MHVASSPLSPAAPSPTSSSPTATATDWLRTASSAPSCSRGLSPSPLPPSLQQYLPRVQDASERMQVIWVLAQFVKASELQKVLLGLVLRRLMTQEQVEVKLEERFAQYQHVSASSPCEA